MAPVTAAGNARETRRREEPCQRFQGWKDPPRLPNDLTRPFWDACNERRLVLQNCTECQRLHYPPAQRCDQCGSADNFEWKEVEGKGHIDVYMVIRDSRIRGVPVGAAHQLWR